MIGEAGLTTALHEAGYTLTERDPDYVVLGETRTYSFERLTAAIRLIRDGARFIATNPDATGPTPDGPLPATGSVAALVSRATGVEPYYVGKPNPLMMRSALNAIDAHSEHTAMIGDRMDTDVISGLEAGLHRSSSSPARRRSRRPSASPTARRGSSTRSPTSCPSWVERPPRGKAVGDDDFGYTMMCEQSGRTSSCATCSPPRPPASTSPSSATTTSPWLESQGH